MHRFLTILTVFSLALASCGNGGVEEWNGGNKPSGGDDNQPVVPASERWAALADSCTNVLVTNYLDVATGTFWSSPRDVEHGTKVRTFTGSRPMPSMSFFILTPG